MSRYLSKKLVISQELGNFNQKGSFYWTLFLSEECSEFLSAFLFYWPLFVTPWDFLKCYLEEGFRDCEIWEANPSCCSLQEWFHTFLLCSLVFLYYLCLIISHVLDGPTNTEESIVQYLWWSGYMDVTFVAMKKLCSRYIPGLGPVMYYSLTNNTSQEGKKTPCPKPNLKCKHQCYCG